MKVISVITRFNSIERCFDLSERKDKGVLVQITLLSYCITYVLLLYLQC